MNGSVSYDYSSGDLLERPNTYFYAKFQGAEFLDAWRHQRMTAAIAVVSAEVSGKSSLLCAPTDLLLSELYSNLTTSGGHESILPTLDRLLQRFEVTKRLHGEYNASWRPIRS